MWVDIIKIISNFQQKQHEFSSFFSMFNSRLEFGIGILWRQQWIVFLASKIMSIEANTLLVKNIFL